MYGMTSFTQVMPWAFKLCLAKVTAPSLLYMTVAYMYTVNRCCLEQLHGWVFWQLLTALSLSRMVVKPHQAGEAYRREASVVALATSWSCCCGSPWVRNMRRACIEEALQSSHTRAE